MSLSPFVPGQEPNHPMFSPLARSSRTLEDFFQLFFPALTGTKSNDGWLCPTQFNLSSNMVRPTSMVRKVGPIWTPHFREGRYTYSMYSSLFDCVTGMEAPSGQSSRLMNWPNTSSSITNAKSSTSGSFSISHFKLLWYSESYEQEMISVGIYLWS